MVTAAAASVYRVVRAQQRDDGGLDTTDPLRSTVACRPPLLRERERVILPASERRGFLPQRWKIVCKVTTINNDNVRYLEQKNRNFLSLDGLSGTPYYAGKGHPCWLIFRFSSFNPPSIDRITVHAKTRQRANRGAMCTRRVYGAF